MYINTHTHTGGPASANKQLEGQLALIECVLSKTMSSYRMRSHTGGPASANIQLEGQLRSTVHPQANIYASKLNLYASKLNLYGCTGAHCPALVSRQVRCPWHARGVLRGQVCVCVKHSKYVPYMSLICPLYVLIWPEYGPYIS